MQSHLAWSMNLLDPLSCCDVSRPCHWEFWVSVLVNLKWTTFKGVDAIPSLRCDFSTSSPFFSLRLSPWPTCSTSMRPLIWLLISNAYSRNQPHASLVFPSFLKAKIPRFCKIFFWLGFRMHPENEVICNAGRPEESLRDSERWIAFSEF